MVIDRLLQLAWWDWDDDKVIRAVDQLCSDDVTAFLATYVHSGPTATGQ
jgi:hypothetical protein